MQSDKLKMWLNGGPLDGSQYSFNGMPIEKVIYFKYDGQKLAYGYKEEYTIQPVVVYEFLGVMDG